MIGGYPLQIVASSVVSGSQSWVLLAIPSFVFAGRLMERCGMSKALVELARAMVGWLPGGLGMSVIAVAYLFSDLCGSVVAEISTLSTALMRPLSEAGYSRSDSASLMGAGASMGMLVPPAIFMIVISSVTNTSAIALFLAGFIPAALMAFLLCLVVLARAMLSGWPRDTSPSVVKLAHAFRDALVPLFVPVIIFGGLYGGAFTTTEAGAVVALYAILAARFYYRTVSWLQIGEIGYESGLLTAAVVFLTATATIFQYLLGVTHVPTLLGDLLRPLQAYPSLFLIGVSIISMIIGMALEGLPAAVLFVPITFPIAMRLHIDPVHFCIVQTAAVGIGLFMPPLGIGMLVALRFAEIPMSKYFNNYWPYAITLLAGLLLMIFFPQISLFLPRSAGFIR
jgi:tripartite ATP-independent transporter DctM subunit